LTRQASKRARSSPGTFAAVLALLAALLVLPLALAPRAEAFVYWTMNYVDRTSDSFTVTIGRANPDGTGISPYFIDAGRAGDTPDPAAVAVGARHVYWTKYNYRSRAGAIGRARLDGTHVDRKLIITGAGPSGLAVDAQHVYWTSGYPTNRIGRANLDGTGIDESFINTARTPGDLAVDANHLYWTYVGAGAIARANLDGADVDESFITPPATLPAGSVAVNASHVYWTTSIARTTAIGRANVDGTEVIPRLVDAWAPGGIAVDANYIYLAGETDGLYRLSLDDPTRGGLIAEFSDVHGVVDSVAVDGLTDERLAGRARAIKTQKQRGKRVVVKVRVKAKERLSAKASGKIKVNPTYKLRPKKVKLAAGENRTLKLKPKKKAQAKKIARVLKRGEKAKANLKVKLTDLAGNRETEKLRVRLKRG
jgi:hypothetical protein